MKRILTLAPLLLLLLHAPAQCPTQNITGNFTPTNGQVLSGTYNITGVFHIPLGFTVLVAPQTVNNCGFLEIYADSIWVEGTLSAVGSGFPGGTGGVAGFCLDSVRFQDCSLASQCMGITPVTFGAAGADGAGMGFGNGGTNGTNGSGRKNSCNATSDRVGRVGGSGGGGGGAGGSYGGMGGNAGAGTAATIPIASSNSPNNSCSPAVSVPFVAGNGGSGGVVTAGYGTNNGNDFALGSGGGGAGGGGRGYFPAQNGENGGNGGGAIRLVAQKGLHISGNVLADGQNGGKGGDGGDGGESPRCCIDACPQVNEYTYVGAGGGGAGGGGGSGGAIWLEANGNLQITGTVSASGGLPGESGQGGAGDSASYQEPPFICGTASGIFTSVNIAPALNAAEGGAGGGGRIKIFYDDCAWNDFSGIIAADSGGLGATNGSLHFGQKPTTFAIGTVSANPNPQSICALTGIANPLTASIAALTYAPLYQWQMQTDCSGGWVNIAGANSLTFIPTNLVDTACFRLLVNSGNCGGIYQDTAQVLTIPAPGYALNTTSVSFCANDSANLTITGILPAGSTIQWYQNGSPVSVANGGTSNPLTVYNAGAYFAQVSAPTACTGNSDTAIVAILPPPNGNVSASSTTFCAGDSVMLVATGGGNYQWLAPLVSSDDTVYVGQNGIFCVEVSNPITNCSATFCSPQLSQGLNPVADIQALNNTNICSGDTVYFVTTASANNIWLLDGTPIAGQTGQNLSATQAGQYSVIAVFSQNCRDTSATLTVTVQPQITANIMALTDTTLCTGDTAILAASGGSNYQWLGPTGNITQDTLYTTIAGNYQLVATNNLGTCPDTSAILSLSFLPNPTPVISLGNGTNPFCLGDSLTLTCVGYVAYQWYQDGNLLAGENGSSLTVYNAGNYSVSVTDVNGCGGSSANFGVQTSMLNPPVILGDDLICVGQSTNLQAAGNYSSYQWTLNGSNIANTANITTNQAGTYILTVTLGACVANSAPFDLNFANAPTVFILPNGNIPVCSADFPVLFTAFGAGIHQWYKNNNPIPGATNDSLYAGSPGAYQVVGTDTEGCKDTSQTAVLTQIPAIQASIQANGSLQICRGDSLMLVANHNNVLAWLLDGVVVANSAGQNPFFAKEEGLYQVVVADTCGNDTSNIPVNVSFIKITADFSYQPAEVFTGESVQFTNLSQISGNPLWVWDFGDGNTSPSKNPRHTYEVHDTIIVSLIAILLPSGCTDTISKSLVVHARGNVFFPNVFTPNQDGKNDAWKAEGIEISDFSLTIRDRWGRVITIFDEISDAWDGTKDGENLPEGVYTYQYQLTFYDGKTSKGAGTITLIR